MLNTALVIAAASFCSLHAIASVNFTIKIECVTLDMNKRLERIARPLRAGLVQAVGTP